MTRNVHVVLSVALCAACKFPPPPDVPDDDVAADADVDGPRGCQRDAECASDLCDQGTCAPNGKVLFVRPDGADGGSACTDQANPCRTITHALLSVPLTADDAEGNRRYIKLMTVGSYLEPDSVRIEARTVAIVGAPPSGVDRSVVSIQGLGDVVEIIGSDVRLSRLEVSYASDGSGSGVYCRADSEEASFVGDDLVVYFNRGIGIEADACAVSLFGSLVSTNRGGGIRVTSARAILVNSVIVGNGTSGAAGSSFGGIALAPSVAPDSVVESNTVVFNHAATGFPDISCAVAGLTVRNLAVVGDATRPRVEGACSFDHVLYGPDDSGGRLGTANGNMLVVNEADLRFANPAMRDYHILPTSVAKGKGTTTGLAIEAMTDIDGQPRPQGAPDVGADEIPD